MMLYLLFLFQVIDKKVTYYSEKDTPRAYQHNGHVHWGHYNISATKPLEKVGNASMEFPWNIPGGTHKGDGTSSLKFHYIPGPIVWWRDRSPDGKTQGIGYRGEPVIRWEYPQGTVFGEVLTIK